LVIKSTDREICKRINRERLEVVTIVEDRHTREPFDENGSTRSMDVDIVDMSSDKWDKGKEVFEGIVHGFELLREELTQVEGFRVTLYDVDYKFTGENSWGDLSDALEQQGFDEAKHYHVVYDGRILPSKIGSYHNTHTEDETMWHDEDVEGISGLSLKTTYPLTVSSYVRGLHQLMHNYINPDIATKYADSDDDYDAVHELGTSTSEARTVMADRFLLPGLLSDPMSRGECDDPDCRYWCAPDDGTLTFSKCSLNTVEESILRNRS
jgi:hypothetical protein